MQVRTINSQMHSVLLRAPCENESLLILQKALRRLREA